MKAALTGLVSADMREWVSSIAHGHRVYLPKRNFAEIKEAKALSIWQQDTNRHMWDTKTDRERKFCAALSRSGTAGGHVRPRQRCRLEDLKW